MKLTVHLLIQNNEATIRQTLDSLRDLRPNILVGNPGHKDNTGRICETYGAKVVRLSLSDDRSAARNELLKHSQTEWNMWLEPWEVLLGGQECLDDLTPGSYYCQVLQGEMATKQIRLWNKNLQFRNPVFETLVDPDATFAPLVFWAGRNNDTIRQWDLVQKWKTAKPLEKEPYYYEACIRLAQRNYKEFLTLADQYLFRTEEHNMSTTMTRYYCAVVQCYVTKNLEEALRNTIICLDQQPLMAEFWCLLGDIYFQIRSFAAAAAFYENAVTLGSRRLQTDRWPLHIPKYQEYPQEMLAKCKEIVSKSAGLTPV